MPPALRIRLRDRDVDAPRPSSWSAGPPLRLPAAVDRIAEGWWRLTPRTRAAVGVVTALALLVAVVLRLALSPYGPPAVVLVTRADLAVGTTVAATDVERTRWPVELLPAASPATRAELGSARLAADVPAGTVLTRAHLRDAGPLATLAGGAAAVPIPTELLRGVTPAARLDVVGVAGDGSGRVLARDTRVLAIEDGTVWLEVGRDEAADVAAAALRGTLSGAVLAG